VDLEFGVQAFGSGVWGSSCWVVNLGFSLLVFEFGVQAFGFRVWGSGFWVECSRFRLLN